MSTLGSQFGGLAKSEAIAVPDSATVVLGPVDVQLFTGYTIYTENAGGGSGNDLTNVDVQTAPELAGPWLPTQTVLAGALAAGLSRVDQYPVQVDKYLRVRANCGVGNDTTGNFWISVQGVA